MGDIPAIETVSIWVALQVRSEDKIAHSVRGEKRRHRTAHPKWVASDNKFVIIAPKKRTALLQTVGSASRMKTMIAALAS